MNELEQNLRKSFEDQIFSNEEKYTFKEMILPYQNEAEQLNFARNLAFDIVQEYTIQHYQETSKDLRLKPLKWLEKVVKTIDSIKVVEDKKEICDVLFSPGSEPKNRIIHLISRAKVSIDICVFTISENEIRDAILQAKKRNVSIRIITDNDKANDLGSDVDFLMQNQVFVRKDKSEAHMHHKFAIIDQSILINGSFNWTRSATQYNNENITILNHKELVQKFENYFTKLWNTLGD